MIFFAMRVNESPHVYVSFIYRKIYTSLLARLQTFLSSWGSTMFW
jgi:hypothetical protein